MIAARLAQTTRSIPAWAGETLISPGYCPFSGVYPRVGGGNALSGIRLF